MKRLFVAIDLPNGQKEALSRIQFGVPGARWLKDDQIHLTLCFIGEVNGSECLEIEEGLSQIEAPGFVIQIKGVGHFPPRGEPRILWAGVEKNDTLLHLQKRVEMTLTRRRIEFERRKFIPHITLARLRESPIPRVGQYLQEHALFRTEPFVATEFDLISSTLNPQGARYTKEISFPLSTHA